MNDPEIIQRASAAAVRYLSFRPRSESEVRARLARQYPEHIIDHVVRRLNEINYLDDADFAEAWKSSRRSLKPKSAYAIRRELIAKGVSQEIAESATTDLDDDSSAYDAGSKFSRRLRDSDYPEFHRRLGAHLYRRGFNASVIRKTTGLLWDEVQSVRDGEPLDAEGR